MKTMMIMMTITMVMRKMNKVNDDDTDNIKSVNNAYDLNDMIFNSLLIRDVPQNTQEINMLDLSAVERQMALNEVSPSTNINFLLPRLKVTKFQKESNHTGILFSHLFKDSVKQITTIFNIIIGTSHNIRHIRIICTKESNKNKNKGNHAYRHGIESNIIENFKQKLCQLQTHPYPAKQCQRPA